MYQGSELGSWEVWGMIRAWFGVWFGNPSFFEFRKLCCLSLFFPPSTYYDCYFVSGCNGSTCQTTLDRTWLWRMWRSQCTSMIYIRRPAGVSSGCSGRQPAAARVIPLISLISNTASSQPRSQPAATSQPYSQPPNQQQQLSQPPSQPASQPPRASQLRDNDEILCAWRRFATPWRYVKVARDHRVWPTLVN